LCMASNSCRWSWLLYDHRRKLTEALMANPRLQPDRGPLAVSAEAERIRLGRGG